MIVRANLLKQRSHREQHSDYSFCGKEISFSGFFFCEREIIVNALCFTKMSWRWHEAKSKGKDTKNFAYCAMLGQEKMKCVATVVLYIDLLCASLLIHNRFCYSLSHSLSGSLEPCVNGAKPIH